MDCLQRGLRSLRANWELVPALAVQVLLIVGLTLAGVFVLLAALGIGVVSWMRDLGADWPQRFADDLLRSLEAAPPPLLPLVLPLIAATLVWTVAFGLTCYLQGGVVGVLAEAESAAGPGLPAWRSFRAFSISGFDRQGRRLFWPYFWLNHLLGGVLLAWGLLLLAWVALAVRLAADDSVSLGVAIGCFGLAPLALLLLAASWWSMLAMVEMARWGSGVWQAARRGLTALRRHVVAVLVLWLLTVVGSMAISAVFAPLRLGTAFALRDWLLGLFAVRGVLLVAEILASCALSVVLVAALAALLGLRRPEPEALEAA